MINILLLLVIILTALLYFTGLGWFVGALLLRGSHSSHASEIPLIQKLPLFMISGVMLNYGLTLLVQSLKVSLIIGAILALIGLGFIVKNLIASRSQPQADSTAVSRWIGITVTCGVLLVFFLVEPISRWDARSMWFFHAKMIYFAGTTGLSAGWQNPLIAFSHTDYPNLVPVMAAQLSYIAGYWNEYLPKLSLFLVLVPGIIWMFTFARKTFAFLALFTFIPFSFTPWLWNGYMDGLLSFFFCISLLLLAAYYQTSKTHHLISALVCILLLINLKNEGDLALLSFILVLAAILLMSKKRVQLRALIQSHWKTILGLVILLLPFLIWSYYKKKWGLVNDLEIGTADSVVRLLTRIKDGSYLPILKSEYAEIIDQFIILCLFLFAAATWKVRLPKALGPVMLTTVLYLAGITAVYLLTPHDLNWHLYSSVARTMMPVNGGLIVAWYLLLDKMESHQLTVAAIDKSQA